MAKAIGPRDSPAFDALAGRLSVGVEEEVPDLEEEASVHRVPDDAGGVVRIVMVAAIAQCNYLT